MIIYNYKKEFVGIEKKDLQALKLSSLAELQNEVADFADLFVKTPGYIHNFKHVHWLDFIASADAIDENRVIINVKGRNFKAMIDLQPLFLVDNPQKEAYGVVLTGLRELTKDEIERISSDLAQRSVEKPAVAAPAATIETKLSSDSEAALDVVNNSEDSSDEVLEEPLTLDFGQEEVEEKPTEPLTKPLKDEPLEISLSEVEENSITVDEPEENKYVDYHYDPGIAAKELGLPIDLVEEFIQDFIAQSLEFKPDLYEALNTGRIDNLRMLSHKLKGVAGNLRIEDAYDALITINTSDDIDLVKRTLDRFYNYILKKIAGEEVEIPTASATSPTAVSQTPQEEAPLETDLDIKTEEESESEDLLEVEEPVEFEEEKIDLLLDDEELPTVAEQKESSQESEDDVEKIDIDLDEEFELEKPIEAIEEPLESVSNEEESLEVELKDDSTTSFDSSDEMSQIVVDTKQAASRIGIDRQMYEELLKDYIDDMQEGIAQLQELLASRDDERTKQLALRLKGMSDNMHLEQIAKELEKFIKTEGANRDVLLKTIQAQINTIERV